MRNLLESRERELAVLKKQLLEDARVSAFCFDAVGGGKAGSRNSCSKMLG